MKLPKLNKKIALVTGVVVLGSIGGVSASMANQPKTGADTSPIVTEVDNHEDRLKNHEARISNLETNQRVLQTNTNTQSSPNTVAVPTVRDVTASTTTSTATAAPSVDTPAVTVTAYKEIPLDADNSDCEYTYSDGTTYRFHWKTVAHTGSGEKAIQTSGFCDDRALGQSKS